MNRSSRIEPLYPQAFGEGMQVDKGKKARSRPKVKCRCYVLRIIASSMAAFGRLMLRCCTRGICALIATKQSKEKARNLATTKQVKWKSEDTAKRIFEDLTGRKFPKCRPKFLDGLELDGYCEELRIAFEYQGKQHYTHVPFFHETQSAFTEQKKRDSRKIDILRTHGIVLIPIHYIFTHKKEPQMREFIEEQLRISAKWKPL